MELKELSDKSTNWIRDSNPSLFLDYYGYPLSFNFMTHNPDEYRIYNTLIKAYGGKLIGEFKPTTIALLKDDGFVKPLKPSFNVNYITDCISENKLVDIGDYIFDNTCLGFDKHSCMDVIFNRKGNFLLPAVKERLPELSQHSTSLSDDMGPGCHHTIMSARKPVPAVSHHSSKHGKNEMAGGCHCNIVKKCRDAECHHSSNHGKNEMARGCHCNIVKKCRVAECHHSSKHGQNEMAAGFHCNIVKKCIVAECHHSSRHGKNKEAARCHCNIVKKCRVAEFHKTNLCVKENRATECHYNTCKRKHITVGCCFNTRIEHDAVCGHHHSPEYSSTTKSPKRKIVQESSEAKNSEKNIPVCSRSVVNAEKDLANKTSEVLNAEKNIPRCSEINMNTKNSFYTETGNVPETASKTVTEKSKGITSSRTINISSDSSDDGPIWDFENMPPKLKRMRSPYTLEEKEAILKFLIKFKKFKNLRGDNVWKTMELRGVCPGRTYQSLKEHFTKQIVYELNRFSFITDQQKKLFSAYRK